MVCTESNPVVLSRGGETCRHICFVLVCIRRKTWITIPWRIRSPIRVFISAGFVSIQLLARDHGFKLGFVAKNWLAYIFVCSANNCHISSSINFWKHSRTLISSSKSTFTPHIPSHWRQTGSAPSGQLIWRSSHTSVFMCFVWWLYLCGTNYILKYNSGQFPCSLKHTKQ